MASMESANAMTNVENRSIPGNKNKREAGGIHGRRRGHTAEVCACRVALVPDSNEGKLLGRKTLQYPFYCGMYVSRYLILGLVFL